jgi:hypothetical protein
MNIASDSTRSRALTGRRRRRILVLAGWALALAMGAVGAQPKPTGPLTVPAAEPELPNGANDYVYDRFFAVGGISVDRFAGTSNASYEGQKLVRLPGGDVVVAGLVPAGAGAQQLGIVRYSPSGRRVTWPAISAPFGHNASQYILYPNGAANSPRVTNVAAIAQRSGYIYVLVDDMYPDGLDKYRPAVVVFADTGRFVGWWFIHPDNDVYNNARDMAIIGNKLTLLGGNSAGGWWTKFWTARFAINADGTLSHDASFGGNGVSVFTLSASAGGCSDAQIGGLCPITGIALDHAKGLTVPLAPKFYVAFTKKYDNSGDHDPCVARFNGNGSLDSAFNGGVACVAFDNGGNREDRAVALHTDYHTVIGGGGISTVEDIYVTASVARDFSAGVGVMRLNSSGGLNSEFGNGGKVVFGGCGTGCTVNLGPTVPRAMARNGANLAVVGYWDPNLVDDPQLAVINATNGSFLSFRTMGISYGDSIFADVVAGPSGGFTMAGWAKDESVGTWQRMYFTSQALPEGLSNDIIFRYGHE